MAYETVVFFSWLSQRGGPPAVTDFLGRMRGGDQTALLRDLVPLADWTAFVETWLDGGVSFPGGVAIQPAPAISAEGRFDSSITLDLDARPFVIERWDMSFVREKLFALDYGVTSGTMQAAMKQRGTGDGWAPPPDSIDTCNEEKRYLLYHTATDGPATATLDIQTDEDTTGGACCLVGAWQPTDETLAGIASEGMDIGAPMIAAAGGSMSCEYGGGGWVLSFAADKTGKVAFQDHATRCEVSGRGGTMVTTSSRTGETDFKWVIMADGAASTSYTSDNVVWTHRLQIGPVSQVVGGDQGSPSGLPSGFAFTCEGDALTVMGIYGLSHREAAHTRIAAPAP
jgi:hypothetical protein